MITWFRNILYDLGIKKSTSYDFPVIVVGNLSVGGTGKSPMIEYLIRLVEEQTLPATLSRGYKRETKGFRLVSVQDMARDVGDEPLQFKTKFPKVLVGVDKDRRNGIKELRSLKPVPQIILLDDAYQHRKIKAGFYILLTAFDHLYCEDSVLPTGDLREPKSGANRANVIIVTKCPSALSEEAQIKIKKKLDIQAHQKLFFTTIKYDAELRNQKSTRALSFFDDQSFTLVTGIANPTSLVNYYKALHLSFEHKNYPDHHNFKDEELQDLQQKKYIITTEKDYVRLKSHLPEDRLWFQPIQMEFIDNRDEFDHLIMEYVKK